MKKIRIEFVVLGVLSLILVLYLVFNNASKKMNYNLPTISKVKQEDVTRLVIESTAGGVINITKSGDTWMIDPQGYKVDDTAMKDILTNAADLQLTDLVSQAGFYTEFELDEKDRVKVTAYDSQNKIVRVFEVGKQANTYNHTYVKLENDKNVYYAKGNLKLIYNKKLEELRDKKILKFDKNTAKKIVITQQYDKKQTEPVTLIKTETPQAEPKKDPAASAKPEAAPSAQPVEWKSPSGKAWDITKVNQILENTFDLACKDYAPANEDVSKPYFTINIEADKPYELKVFAPKPDGTYPAMSSMSKYVFYLQSWNGTSLKEAIDALAGIKPAPTAAPAAPKK